MIHDSNFGRNTHLQIPFRFVRKKEMSQLQEWVDKVGLSKVFPLKEASRRSNCKQKQKQECKPPERSGQSLAGYGTSLPT